MENFFLTTAPGLNVPDLLIKDTSGQYSLRKTEKKMTLNGLKIIDTLIYMKGNQRHRDDDEPSVIISQKIENVTGMIDFYEPTLVMVGIHPLVERLLTHEVKMNILKNEDYYPHVPTINFISRKYDKYTAGPLQLSIITRLWYKNGQLHRENKPAFEHTIQIADDRPTVYEQRSLTAEPVVISKASRQVFVSCELYKHFLEGEIENSKGAAVIYDRKDMIHQEYDHREYYLKNGVIIDPNYILTPKVEDSIETAPKMTESTTLHKSYLKSLQNEREKYENLIRKEKINDVANQISEIQKEIDEEKKNSLNLNFNGC